jgi:hypothetical protein
VDSEPALTIPVPASLFEQVELSLSHPHPATAELWERLRIPATRIKAYWNLPDASDPGSSQLDWQLPADFFGAGNIELLKRGW